MTRTRTLTSSLQIIVYIMNYIDRNAVRKCLSHYIFVLCFIKIAKREHLMQC